MKQVLTCLLLLCASVVSADGALTVKSVEAQQRYPWNGLVDIVVTISGNTNEIAQTECMFVATNCTTSVAIPIVTISRTGENYVAGGICKRSFIWNASADIGEKKVDNLALTVDVKILGGVQLWENGPYWAECNAGATSPEGYGYYFWWGDTIGYVPEGGTFKSNYGYYYNEGVTWVSSRGTRMNNSPFGDSVCPTHNKSRLWLKSAGYIDSTGNLVSAHDGASAHLGWPWRMPRDSEIAALINNCTSQWTTSNGVYGCLVKGKGSFSSRSIFLPAAGGGTGLEVGGFGSYSGFGRYWSATPDDDAYPFQAWLLDCDRYKFSQDDASYYRSHGLPIRALRECSK